jgi:chemotaxis family two-component system response regulator Rcp1
MARATDHGPFEVLLVEDNPGDVDLVLEVLAGSSVPHRVSVARDGEDALARLHKEGDYAGVHSPDLILLDLNLPKKNGRDVLADVKEDPALRHIPVVILTSSDLERDLLETYRMHANCFVTKPTELEDYWSAVREIERFWLGRACLPAFAR